MNIKFFKKTDEIMIFIKGNKHAWGYIVYFPKEDRIIDIKVDRSDFLQNESEFFALNEAIRKYSHKYRIINIYTNLELIKNFINRVTKPNKLQIYLDEFKELTKDLTVMIKWVKKDSGQAQKISDVQGEEEEFAQEKLREIDNAIKNFKGLSL